MIQKYKSASRLAKIFIWLSIFLTLGLAITYTLQLHYALNMNPNSFNCLHDSMMKQICEDPYGSSITWALIRFSFFACPFLIAWLGIGVTLLARSDSKLPSSRKKNNG